MFWKLIYRGKFSREDGLIEASDFKMAEAVGKKYCEGKALKFIAVQDPVLARESEYFPSMSEKLAAGRAS